MIVLTQHGPASMFDIPDKWSYRYQLVYIRVYSAELQLQGRSSVAARQINNIPVKPRAAKEGRPYSCTSRYFSLYPFKNWRDACAGWSEAEVSA